MPPQPVPVVLDPAEIITQLRQGLHRSNSLTNPSRCSCGNYSFYSICGHKYNELKVKCGNTVSDNYTVVFCRTPAPRIKVTNVLVNKPCSDCAEGQQE